MKIINDVQSTYKSPIITIGDKVIKWSIWVPARIKFNPDETRKLDGYDFDELTSPLICELYAGELELINSEIIDSIPEHEVSKRVKKLRTELNDTLNKVVEMLIEEFDFKLIN